MTASALVNSRIYVVRVWFSLEMWDENRASHNSAFGLGCESFVLSLRHSIS
jgi:hypothetical protein